MTKTTSNRFVLQAMINGATIQGRVVMDHGILVQQMEQGSGTPTPNWANSDHTPIFHAEATNSSTGENLQVNEPKLIYNNSEVGFDKNWATTDLTEHTSSDGRFKRQVSLEGGMYVTKYKFVQSPFNGNNQNSDSFHIEGKVLLEGGNSQDFRTEEEPVTVIMVSSGGVAYFVKMQAWDLGSDSSDAGKVRAQLIKVADGKAVDDSSLTAKWYEVDGNKETAISDSDTTNYGISDDGNGLYTLEIKNNDMVNGDDVFCAAFTFGGDTYKGYANITDLTDGYYVAYSLGGDVDGGYVQTPKDAGKATPVAVVDIDVISRDTGNPVTNLDLYPHVALKQAGGSDVTPASSVYFVSSKCKGKLKVTYQQVISWGGMLSGYISLEPTQATGYSSADPSAS